MPPVQVVEALAGVATTMPVGRLSVKSSPVASTTLALLSMLKLSVLTAPSATVAGAKALPNSGASSTVKVALATPALPISEVSALLPLA